MYHNKFLHGKQVKRGTFKKPFNAATTVFIRFMYECTMNNQKTQRSPKLCTIMF